MQSKDFLLIMLGAGIVSLIPFTLICWQAKYENKIRIGG